MKIILLTFFIFPLIGFSQKIKVESEIDKFTKQKRVKTSYVAIKPGMAEQVTVSLRSVDTMYFITFKGRGKGSGVIGSTDRIIILLDNDSTVSIMPTGIQSYDIGYGTAPDSYTHQYFIKKEDLINLSTHDLKSFRKYYDRHYADIDINEKRKGDLRELASEFLKELNK